MAGTHRLRSESPHQTIRRCSMKSLLVLLVVFVLVAACGGGAASTLVKSAVPPGPLTKYQDTLSALNATTQVDLIQNVIDHAPRAALVAPVHRSPNIATRPHDHSHVQPPARVT